MAEFPRPSHKENYRLRNVGGGYSEINLVRHDVQPSLRAESGRPRWSDGILIESH